jgi:hypothetical protein
MSYILGNAAKIAATATVSIGLGVGAAQLHRAWNAPNMNSSSTAPTAQTILVVQSAEAEGAGPRASQQADRRLNIGVFGAISRALD